MLEHGGEWQEMKPESWTGDKLERPMTKECGLYLVALVHGHFKETL